MLTRSNFHTMFGSNGPIVLPVIHVLDAPRTQANIEILIDAGEQADLGKVEFDVAGGLDAMGFVLGAAIAARRKVGFLPIRKAGKPCVETDKVAFTNYSGRTQDMELRLPAFTKGDRDLLVDQWVETGGTMDGAIRLVERQGGVVAGLVPIGIEENETTLAYRARCPCITAIVPGSKWQADSNAQRFSSFDTYEPAAPFPNADQ